jgi:hypothetical protein
MIEIVGTFVVCSKRIMEDNIRPSIRIFSSFVSPLYVNVMVCAKKQHCESILKNNWIKWQNWEQFTFTRVDLHISK